MSLDHSEVVALQNAWNGAVAAADRLRTLAPGDAPTDADLEALHNAALADANALMALRGLIEQLRRKSKNSP
jgi:hypothetical protein